MPLWRPQDARETYALAAWSDGYVDVGMGGNLIVRCAGNTLDLGELVQRLGDAGAGTPVLVRILDVLHDRVSALCDAFDAAIAADGYAGTYQPLYPIKVNQQRSVVTTLLTQKRVGLEAGSKPELVVAMAQSRIGGRIVCNGYKDREYVQLALTGRKLGFETVLVLEKPGELDLILEESMNLEVTPVLGLRLRLTTLGAGNWQNTGGEASKFGLSARQILEVLEKLRAVGQLQSLQLLHFHMGSQIPGVRHIQRGVREATRFYVEMLRQGAGIRVLDVGGGLAVDYEGTRSRSECSMNYSLGEYARAVVNGIREVCAEQNVSEPGLCTEAGRAMTAHHAILITDVVDVERIPDGVPADIDQSAPEVLQMLHRELSRADERSPHELVHEADHCLAEARSLYVHGLIGLKQRSQADTLYYALCRRALTRLEPDRRGDRELIDRLQSALADKYFCNFSVFQSIPDVWAINQVFPIVPLQRLDEAPQRRALIKDLTCDSDGRIDRYVEAGSIEETLPVHDIGPEERYLLGIFLVGAYQETLGDIHNLFGDTHSVDVHVDAGGFRIENLKQGDAADDILTRVGYGAEQLKGTLRELIIRAQLPDQEGAEVFERLSRGLSGYTYLER